MSGHDVDLHARPSAVANDFRAVMRRFASSLTIVTTQHEGRRAGMLATACCSVSAHPPSIVVGVNRSSNTWPLITQRGMFACNLLGDQHSSLVHPFSSSETAGQERFALGNWQDGDLGIPFLADALGVLFCSVAAHLTFGTHTLFIGEVRQVLCPADGACLLWHNGAIATLRQAAAGKRSRRGQKKREKPIDV